MELNIVNTRKHWSGLASCKAAWFSEHFNRHRLKYSLHHAPSHEYCLLCYVSECNICTGDKSSAKFVSLEIIRWQKYCVGKKFQPKILSNKYLKYSIIFTSMNPPLCFSTFDANGTKSSSFFPLLIHGRKSLYFLSLMKDCVISTNDCSIAEKTTQPYTRLRQKQDFLLWYSA